MIVVRCGAGVLNFRLTNSLKLRFKVKETDNIKFSKTGAAKHVLRPKRRRVFVFCLFLHFKLKVNARTHV